MNICTYTLMERMYLSEQCAVPSGVGVSKDYFLSRLREDLSALFNTCGLGSTLDHRVTPHVSRSVLNYGIGSIAGRTLSSLDPQVLEKRIRQAIFAFEPRIIRHSLQVTWVGRSNASAPEVQFIIEGQLRAASAAYPFKFCSVWNAESGGVSLDPPGAGVPHG